MIHRTLIWLGSILLILCAAVSAAVPQQLTYQGRLSESGTPVTGSRQLTLRLYNTAGTPVWSSGALTVSCVSGLFSVQLGGAGQPQLPASLFSDTGLTVGITVGAGAELTPRTRLSSVAFSYKSLTADTASAALAVADNAVTSAKIANATIQLIDIAQNGATTGQVIKWNGSAWVVANDSIAASGTGIYLPLAGGTMTGAITSSGDPSITMGKGTFGKDNGNLGPWSFVTGVGNSTLAPYTGVLSGLQNRAASMSMDSFAVVAGGFQNGAYGRYSFVGSGLLDTAYGAHSVIGGGWFNRTHFYGVIGGGAANAAYADYSSVLGGWGNYAAGNCSNIGGGFFNRAGSGLADSGSVVAGGYLNEARREFSSVGGGFGDTAATEYSTVGGGQRNRVFLKYSTIGGGQDNIIISPLHTYYDACTIGGGNKNKVDGEASSMIGGQENEIGGSYSVIGGGYQNGCFGMSSSVVGGEDNYVSGDHSFVGGGYRVSAQNYFSVAVGGADNAALGHFTFIGGGTYNQADSEFAVVSGGFQNRAAGPRSVIAGGYNNSTPAQYSTVSGGSDNSATGVGSLVSGGCTNLADTAYSVVGGGVNDTATGAYSTVCGGNHNVASAEGATVLGGASNIASGPYSTVAGGTDNQAGGWRSFVCGFAAKATHGNTFMFGDGEAVSFYSDRSDQAKFRVAGGFFLDVNNGRWVEVWDNGAGRLMNTSTGAYLTTGGTWTNASSRALKENFTDVDGQEVLDKLERLAISRWNYITESDEVKHIGPTAEDFVAAFGLGNDSTSISTVDPSGIALAAIKALNGKVSSLQAENSALKTKNDDLEARLLGLEQAVRKLSERK